jgi:hypothetical protein
VCFGARFETRIGDRLPDRFEVPFRNPLAIWREGRATRECAVFFLRRFIGFRESFFAVDGRLFRATAFRERRTFRFFFVFTL